MVLFYQYCQLLGAVSLAVLELLRLAMNILSTTPAAGRHYSVNYRLSRDERVQRSIPEKPLWRLVFAVISSAHYLRYCYVCVMVAKICSRISGIITHAHQYDKSGTRCVAYL